MKARTLVASALAIAMGAGLSFQFEGPRHLSAYLDPLVIPTICRGITANVRMGDKETDRGCDARELAAVTYAYETVKRCAGVPMYEHEWAAWISFTYNVGPGKRGVKSGFCVLKNGNEPTLLRLLKDGDYTGACNELPKWDNPKWLPGIKRRRLAEQQTCLGNPSEDLTS